MTPVVLVVDDNRLVLEALADFLRHNGFTVIAQTDSERALDDLRDRSDISALVCDFRMPKKDGAELARAAKAQNPTILVLMISILPEPCISGAPWDKWFCKNSTTAAAVVKELRGCEIFPDDVVKSFGGEEGLLSTLESLSSKLRRTERTKDSTYVPAPKKESDEP